MSVLADHIRPQFPVLSRKIGGKPLLYLDSAATTQKPEAVLIAMNTFSREHMGNVHRGMHVLAEEATDAYEAARETVRKFLNAAYTDEIIFTKGTTESINLVARSMDMLLKRDDSIALTLLEHHSNIVPWQQLRQRTGAAIGWIGIDDRGLIDETSVEKILSSRNLRLIAVTGMSNVLGVRPDLQKLIAAAHAKNVWVLVDAAQLAAHDVIDVQKLDVDFLAFSGHKIYGPTGIGVLFGKRAVLEKLPPFLGGGNMIEQVTLDGFTPADAPAKFEAGTPPITEAVGLAAAIKWMQQWPLSERRAHERELFSHALSLLSTIPSLTILGPGDPSLAEGLISFAISGIHPHDLTSVLGSEGICLRAGHHCTQPLHHRLGITASSRLSLALYNTKEELDRLPDALHRAIKKLS